jgi:succinylglutamate desuccinylase
VLSRELGRLVGDNAGPTTIVVAGMHGNEPAGLHAARRVLTRLRDENVVLRGELVALAGNVGALRRGTRYQRKNLNRLWTDAQIASLRARDPETHDEEDREQAELLDALEAAFARARGQVHIVDCHTSSAWGVPFIIYGEIPKQASLVLSLRIPILLGLEAQVVGVLSQHYHGRGRVAFSFEGGGHEDPHSILALEAAIWQTLASAGQIDAALPHVDRATVLLEERRGTLPRLISISDRRAIVPEDRFVMEPGFRNIDHARAGQLLARDVRGEIRAPHDGLVVMPLYQGLGSDGYFWGSALSHEELE